MLISFLVKEFEFPAQKSVLTNVKKNQISWLTKKSTSNIQILQYLKIHSMIQNKLRVKLIINKVKFTESGFGLTELVKFQFILCNRSIVKYLKK